MNDMHHHEVESTGEHEMLDFRGHVHGGEEMSMMKMYFHFGLGDVLLFPGLKLDSSLKLSIACLVLLLGSILHEGLNYLRGFVCLCEDASYSNKPTRLVNDLEHQNESSTGNEQPHKRRGCCSGPSGPGLADGAGGCALGPRSKSYRLIQAALQLTRTALSMVLMLAAMTYNVCLIFAIVAGAAIGAYIFQRRRGPQEFESICH